MFFDDKLPMHRIRHIVRAPPQADEGESSSGSAMSTATIKTELAGGWRQHEAIDCKELGVRLNVPESWVREQVRSRSGDPLPHLRLGKYVRFLWGSPELDAWIQRRMISGSNRKAVRALGKENQ